MDSEKLEKSKNNLLEQLEERKKLKKLKKKTKEESDFSDEFGSNKKKLGRRGKGGGMIPKESEPFSRGGRARLKGRKIRIAGFKSMKHFCLNCSQK